MTTHSSTAARLALIVGIGLGSLLHFAGCSKSDSDTSSAGTASGGASATTGGATSSGSSIPGEGPADAVKAVAAELDKHWLKMPDGWTSQYHVAMGGVPGEFDQFIELKDLKFKVEPNGSDAVCTLEATGMRACAPNFAKPDRPLRWMPWDPSPGSQHDLSFPLTKKGATWEVGDSENFMPRSTVTPRIGIMTGAKPDAATVAKLNALPAYDEGGK